MASETHDLVTSYVNAVGEHRLDALPAMLEPDVEFTLGDNTVRGVEAFVAGFRRLMPIILRNDIRKVFVDGDEACVIYDFVTDTPAGAVLSVEHIKFRNGRLASTLLVFERLHWAEALAELADRLARQSASA
ncbi:MAG: nuclear transport factor 2 family protein [Candidatus Dormibacteraeota bacterium]|nr:nuclear transport factor 2 family protein [Candidatus Dormibacteraeota bacterium]